MQGDAISEVAFKAMIDGSTIGIVICDASQTDIPIIYVNEGFQKITLFAREYAIGRSCRFLQGEGTSPLDRERIREAIHNGDEFSGSILNYKADGTAFVNELMISPVFKDGEELSAFFGVLRERADTDDVGTGGGQRPDHVTGSNAMLREIQHRVKNHLSMIVSLIRVQANRPITRESYLALSHRIEALALLYDQLIQPPQGHNSGLVEAGSYLSRVATVIAGIDGRPAVRLGVDCDEIDLPVDPAARLGLLLTELLTNSFGHAFEGRERGRIDVKLRRHDGERVRLTVIDDGIGLPEGSDWPSESDGVSEQRERAETEEGELDTTSHGSSSGLGGSIVLGLTKALDAKLDVRSDGNGTSISVDLDPTQPPCKSSN